MNTIDQAINEMSEQIAMLQDGINALHKVKPLLGGAHAVARPTRESEKSPRRAQPQEHQRIAVGKSGLSQRPGGPSQRKEPTPVPAAPAGGVVLPSDKPDTVPGAIKALLRDEPAGATFEVQLLRANLLENPDYKPLLEAEGGEKSLSNCINNWTNAGHFKKAGSGADAELTITASGKAWFNK